MCVRAQPRKLSSTASLRQTSHSRAETGQHDQAVAARQQATSAAYRCGSTRFEQHHCGYRDQVGQVRLETAAAATSCTAVHSRFCLLCRTAVRKTNQNVTYESGAPTKFVLTPCD